MSVVDTLNLHTINMEMILSKKIIIKINPKKLNT